MKNNLFPAAPSGLNISAILHNDGKEVRITGSLSQMQLMSKSIKFLLRTKTTPAPLMTALASALNRTILQQLEQAGKHEEKDIEINLPLLMAVCTFYHLYKLSRKMCELQNSALIYLPHILEEAIAENSKEAARNYRQWFHLGIEFSERYNPLFLLFKSYEYQSFQTIKHRRRTKLLHNFLNQIPETGKDYQAAKHNLKFPNLDNFLRENLQSVKSEKGAGEQQFVCYLVQDLQQTG